ncbi:MAG TPA: hypothetical protein VD962_02680 [Rubricoccaceae bacterium]|nr:hypothetical protein [Rubricoccaceae bacterium]
MRFLSLLLALLFLAACDTGDDGLSGSLRYAISLDESSQEIARGHITFDAAPREDEAISGEFDLDEVPTPGPVEPLTVTEGELEGTYDGTTVQIRLLEPGSADDGIQLTADYDEDSFSGTWCRETIAGCTGGGTFTATRDD